MKIIDPHIHLFNLSQGDYFWLKAENPPFWPDKNLINNSFTENDLELITPLELTGYVHIEAGFDNQKPWRELACLEKTSGKSFRAIANIDLTAPSQKFEQDLVMLAEHRTFIGVRHLLDDQALSLLSNKQVRKNLRTFNAFKKSTLNTNTYHRLIFETQLPLAKNVIVEALCDVIEENSELNFIINHAGFPPVNIQTFEWQQWRKNLQQLAMFSNVAIKCSGWEMIDRQYQPYWLNKNLTEIFEIFGANKVMLASNFPLCLFSQQSYQNYWRQIIDSEFLRTLTKRERNALCYDNAFNYYGF
ncbi:MAG: amidohydrolase family protein [Kangiellaceae bacterium]|nr:amidohydrolase family protein [Kangiellaceae bacterium]